jgi:glycine betaine/proline transport system substrate-binding protein
LALVVAVALLAAGAPDGPRADPESPDPIRITLNDWTGQNLSARLMGEVLKKGGYRVDYVDAHYLGQLVTMQAGEVHLAMEIWTTTGKVDMDRALATGKVVNLGETGLHSKEEWWYPAYVKDLCPGLPDWRALARCAGLFATPDTAPKGQYLGGPPTWGGHDEERVAALGLNFQVVHAASDAVLFQELQKAVEARRPIVLWVFAPHWVETVFEGEWVQFPPYSDTCYASRRFDCAKPSGPVWKVAWAGLETKWPGAARAIRRFELDNAEMSRMIAKVELGGATIEEVVAAWIATNEARWRAWLR